MSSIQLDLGNSTEKRVSNFFHNKGYWSIILPKNVNGQPFDIIACKENSTWFVDAKHLESSKASFPFDRIESNQELSMRFAKEFANINNLGFVVEWERADYSLFFLSYEEFIKMKKNGSKSVKISDLAILEDIIK